MAILTVKVRYGRYDDRDRDGDRVWSVGAGAGGSGDQPGSGDGHTGSDVLGKGCSETYGRAGGGGDKVTRPAGVASVTRVPGVPVWTARCKSGYEYPRTRTVARIGAVSVSKVEWKECQRACGRGELVCRECGSAVVMPAVQGVSIASRIAACVRGMREVTA